MTSKRSSPLTIEANANINTKANKNPVANAPTKKRAVVICPGRGTYNKEELGYLKRFHGSRVDIVKHIDAYRQSLKQTSIEQLDAADTYDMRLHTAGENASALIYACAISDFHSINQDEYEIVALTGNSMGWYIALSAAGAVDADASIELINTMGSMMSKGIIGGQMIYPITDEHWQVSPKTSSLIEQCISQINRDESCEVYVSIRLGGYVVFGGNKKGLLALEQSLPKVQERYPMHLFNHAAFHSPLLTNVSEQAKQTLPQSLFQAPKIPLIDGLGNIWQPFSTKLDSLYEYTLGRQVVDTYDFTKAIEVSVKEFAPDKLIILGPGKSLGGAVAQSLIQQTWLNLHSKQDFMDLQSNDPFVLSMGMQEQRELCL